MTPALCPSKCPVCDGVQTRPALDLIAVPVYCNVLWPSADAARSAPRGDLRLSFCDRCGHLFNRAFDPGIVDYTVEYENSLHYSPRFQRYAESVATDLVDRLGLRDKDVVEIGCGKGDFLRLLCRLGDNRGVGFDPSYDPGRDSEVAAERVHFVREYYGRQHAPYPADLICCRQALEHFPAPLDFLGQLRRIVGDRSATRLFFEVPNSLYSLRDLGVWDFIYEHVSYFSASSLRCCFERAGFSVERVGEAFGGQFLTLEARLDARTSAEESVPREARQTEDLAALAGALDGEVRAIVGRWRDRLRKAERSGRNVVVWGAGSKGVTFVNLLDPGSAVAALVDINPYKQGKFVPGTGHPVIAPEELARVDPHEVVIMNPLYRKEVADRLAQMGLGAAPVAV